MTIRECSRLAARGSRLVHRSFSEGGFAIGLRAATIAAALGVAGAAFAQPVETPSYVRPLTIDAPAIKAAVEKIDGPAIRAAVDAIDMRAIKGAVESIDMPAIKAAVESINMDLAAIRIEMPSIALAFSQDRERQDRDKEAVEREREKKDRDKESADRERERESRAYEQGRDFLDEGKYDRAIERFNDVIGMKGTRADAALYSKAWAQNKAGQRAEALTTIGTLARDYPKSRYLTQAKVLEAEVRRDSGQPVKPGDQNDEDLKLMAIQAMQNSDPEQTVPMLEKLLQGTASPRVKSRALFVLAQSDSPRAREVMKNIAKGNSTPELQNRAIDYLGTQGGRESRATLAEIYSSSPDVDVKRRILRAFMVAGEKDRLLAAAQSEQNPQLRAEAVQQLGVMGAHDELWQLYQKESAVDVKKRIIQAMFVGGNVTRLIELAKTEKDPELRRTAVRNLGIMGSKETGAALVEIYNTDKTPDIRKAVITGLFQQNNATALIDLARKEQDVEMKKEIVSKLSLMGHDNPEVMKYMMELLNK
jgi:HEAT repeat protein